VLQLADPSKPYVVTCDASDIGVGAVLEQESGHGPHPVAFASRKFFSAERIILCMNGSCSPLSTRSRNGARTCMVVVPSSKRTIIHCVIWILLAKGNLFRTPPCPRPDRIVPLDYAHWILFPTADLASKYDVVTGEGFPHRGFSLSPPLQGMIPLIRTTSTLP
jgi:RNase H-like domain found in reverse transcriptase